MDLTQWPGYVPGQPVYRHHDRAVVAWLDGHVRSHLRSFVSHREPFEDGIPLEGNTRLIRWNRH